MRTLAVVAAALLAATACDAGADDAASTTASAPDAPTPAELVTRSLTRARETRNVHFELRVELAMNAGGRTFEYELTAEGDRTDDGLQAKGRSDGEPYSLVEVDDRLYLESDGVWNSIPTTFGRIVRAESFADLVPADACLDGGSSGCTRIDLGRPLRSGQLGRLLRGVVTDGGDVWELRGTIDSEALTELQDRTTDYYVPYEREGEARYVVGKDDFLPRELVYSYRLDRDAIGEHLQEEPPRGLEERSGRLELRLSQWGEEVTIDAPDGARPAPRALLNRIFDVLFSFFGSYL